MKNKIKQFLIQNGYKYAGRDFLGDTFFFEKGRDRIRFDVSKLPKAQKEETFRECADKMYK